MDHARTRETAFQAYQYLYPLVTMDVTRRQATNVAAPGVVPMKAPTNRFAHFREYPRAEARDVVRFNFDTLYSFAWLDLTEEPVVVTVPDAAGRYYLTPMLDMWTDVFAVPGTRTTEGVRRHFAVAAPGWSGSLPEGVELLPAPTPMVWVMGRVQTGGPADYAAVHAVQDGFGTVPLSRWGTDWSWPAEVPTDPEVDDVTPPLHQVNALDGLELLRRGADLMALHPPHAHDHPVLARMRSIGIVVGEPFDPGALAADVREAVAEGCTAALADLVASVSDGSLAPPRNGWMTIQGGTYGTDYRRRALVALAGLGCNLPEDALYPGTATDADGDLLTGDRSYVLRFGPSQLPPAEAFWSLTMYDAEGFQVPNPIDRFAIGDRDPLVYGPDDSLEIYLQRSSPGPEREPNWLPTPEGEFQPLLRIYSPRPEALRHGIDVPPVRKAGR